MSASIPFQTLQELSQEAGFQICGVTGLTPPAGISRYAEWLDAGFHGAMQYLEKPETVDLKANPAKFAPFARSLIVLGAKYPVNRLPDLPAGLFGRVSSYAWGFDYHDVLRTAADKLVDALKAAAGRELITRVAIDSAPVLEKPLAARAGLGWLGKNSCLINPALGSFFFLANIFTDAEWDGGLDPVPDHCGTCRRCIDACPTGCINPDRTIDARRCISYLTIENKGSIPRELRPALGDRVFGCDVCQSVCPWNTRASDAGVHPAFLTDHPAGLFLDLRDLAGLNMSGFKTRFTGTPLSRAKRTGLLRNALTVMGNLKQEAAIPLLLDILETETDPIIRLHAVWALGQFQLKSLPDVLSRLLEHETDPRVLEEINLLLEDSQ